MSGIDLRIPTSYEPTLRRFQSDWGLKPSAACRAIMRMWFISPEVRSLALGASPIDEACPVLLKMSLTSNDQHLWRSLCRYYEMTPSDIFGSILELLALDKIDAWIQPAAQQEQDGSALVISFSTAEIKQRQRVRSPKNEKVRVEIQPRIKSAQGRISIVTRVGADTRRVLIERGGGVGLDEHEMARVMVRIFLDRHNVRQWVWETPDFNTEDGYGHREKSDQLLSFTLSKLVKPYLDAFLDRTEPQDVDVLGQANLDKPVEVALDQFRKNPKNRKHRRYVWGRISVASLVRRMASLMLKGVIDQELEFFIQAEKNRMLESVDGVSPDRLYEEQIGEEGRRLRERDAIESTGYRTFSPIEVAKAVKLADVMPDVVGSRLTLG